MITAEGAGLEVVDSSTIDHTLTGTGSQADPYSLTSAVKVSPTAVGNLITTQADGLAVTCESVQDCVGNAFGDGLVYDDAGNSFAVDLSGDAGNTAVFGGDGGVFVPATPLVCEAVQDCIGGALGDGLAYDDAANLFTVDLSGDAGNVAVFGGDGGVFVPASPLVCEEVQDCIGGALGDGLVYDDAGNLFSVDLSGDAGNTATFGTDDGVLVSCEAIQDCIGGALGDGLVYDDAGNLFSALLSADPGNNVAFGGDGGLFVPTGAATINVADTPCINLAGDGSGATPLSATPIVDPAADNLLDCTAAGLAATLAVDECGLIGDGSTASPLEVNVGVWPFACSVDTFGGFVACDSTGKLRTAPRGRVEFVDLGSTTDFNDVAVPAGTDVVVFNRSITVNNPDTCRPARVMLEVEVDVSFDLPGGSKAASGIGTDEMTHFRNPGTLLMQNFHMQMTKVLDQGLIAAGGSATYTTPVTASRGTAGAVYNRIQVIQRAWMFIL